MLPKRKIIEVFEELSPQDNGYWEVPDGCYEVEFALVAGGLNGEYSDVYNAGSGGNGGGVLTRTISVNPGVTYRVVVGDVGQDSVFDTYQAIAGKGGRGGYGVEGDGNDPSPGNPGQDGSYVFNNKYPDRYPYPMGAGGGSGAYTRGWNMGFLSGGKGGNHGGEVMELESRILRVLLLMAKMEVMPLIMEVVEEEPLKLLIVGLRAVEEDQVIVVLLFYIILKMDDMDRNDIIKELGSYFDIVELVCPHTYNKWKDRSWQFLDTAFLHNLLILRRDIIKQPMYCNNWDKQGQFSQRGLRCNICQIVKDKKDVYLSAHVLGKAGDFDVKSMTAEQARGLILDHQDMLPYPFRLEGKVGWLHFDSLDTRNGIHAVVF